MGMWMQLPEVQHIVRSRMRLAGIANWANYPTDAEKQVKPALTDGPPEERIPGHTCEYDC